MSRSDEKDCGRKMRMACTNIIGFGQLLQEPHARKFSHVKRLEYRAHMVSSALNLADLVIEHDAAIADLFPCSWEPGLKPLAEAFRTMVFALDGDYQVTLEEQAVEFACHFLRTFNR